MEFVGKKYTADDWINGTVDDEWLDWSPYLSDRERNSFNEPVKRIFKGNEYNKLKRLREQAFEKGVRNNVALQTQAIEQKIENLNQEESLALICEEIEYCDIKYNSSSPDVRHDLRLGKRVLFGLNHNRYKQIIDMDLQNPTSFISLDQDELGKEPDSSNTFQRTIKNQWFEISVNRGYRKELERLKDKNYTSKNNNEDIKPKYDFSEDQLSTAEGKIKFISDIYFNESVTWKKALEIANKVTDRTLYKNEKSFLNASRNLRNRNDKSTN